MVHSLNPLDYPARFQWNQPGISRCLAQTACTDTVVQMIIEYWKEKLVPLDVIRRQSGIPTDCQHGLTVRAALQVLQANGIYWYTWKSNVDGTFVLQQAYNAPVLTGVCYGEYPRQRGKCTVGSVAEIGGKVDCGFRGPHAVLVTGSRPHKDSTGRILHYDAFVRDPDHWEPSPPDYDRMKGTDLTAAVKGLYGCANWTSNFAVYSTKKKTL